MLRTLREPPQKGSLRESVLIVVLQRLEDIEHARWKALVQILVEASQNDVKQGLKAWEQYTQIAFPYLEAQKKQQSKHIKQLMDQEMSRGPVAVTSLLPNRRVRSTLKQAASEAAPGRVPVNLRDFYNKLGRSIPVHDDK